MKITKADLRKIASILILANTPRSFYKELRKTDLVRSLEESCGEKWLYEFYSRLRCRHNRTPIGVALAYTVLIALLRKRPSAEFTPDVEPFMWGEEIQSLVASEAGTSSSIITSSSQFISNLKSKENFELFLR